MTNGLDTNAALAAQVAHGRRPTSIPGETFTILDSERPALVERHRADRVTDELLKVFGADQIRTVAFVGVRSPLELDGRRRSVRFRPRATAARDR